jgi:hypothetical protein
LPGKLHVRRHVQLCRVGAAEQGAAAGTPAHAAAGRCVRICSIGQHIFSMHLVAPAHKSPYIDQLPLMLTPPDFSTCLLQVWKLPLMLRTGLCQLCSTRVQQQQQQLPLGPAAGCQPPATPPTAAAAVEAGAEAAAAAAAAASGGAS